MTERLCQHCGERPAAHEWDLTACANQRKKFTAHLCTPCDIDLNALTLRFVQHPQAEELIAAYIEEKGPGANPGASTGA